MMFCRYCGKQILDDSTFCPFCGKALGEPEKSDVSVKSVNIKKSVPVSGVENYVYHKQCPNGDKLYSRWNWSYLFFILSYLALCAVIVVLAIELRSARENINVNPMIPDGFVITYKSVYHSKWCNRLDEELSDLNLDTSTVTGRAQLRRLDSELDIMPVELTTGFAFCTECKDSH